jgi:hypothetical protein
MATAKQKRQVTVEDHCGKKVKVECAACFDEYGSYACLRPAHGIIPSPFKTKVVQDEETPVEKEVLATAITAISDAVKKLEKSGLNRKAIIALINDDTKLGKGLIETVLISLRDLEKNYANPRSK